MGTRTCIRDSLFRLAGSAAQRCYTNDVAHSNKTSQDDQEVIPKEESSYRLANLFILIYILYLLFRQCRLHAYTFVNATEFIVSIKFWFT